MDAAPALCLPVDLSHALEIDKVAEAERRQVQPRLLALACCLDGNSYFCVIRCPCAGVVLPLPHPALPWSRPRVIEAPPHWSQCTCRKILMCLQTALLEKTSAIWILYHTSTDIIMFTSTCWLTKHIIKMGFKYYKSQKTQLCSMSQQDYKTATSITAFTVIKQTKQIQRVCNACLVHKVI